MAISIKNLFGRNRKAKAHSTSFVSDIQVDFEEEQPEFFTQEELEELEYERQGIRFTEEEDLSAIAHLAVTHYYYDDEEEDFVEEDIETAPLRRYGCSNEVQKMNDTMFQMVYDHTIGGQLSAGGVFGYGSM
ncbi:TPA: hypothetical protein SMO99_002986 [Proteus mirabilis]|uniref:Uncharacterized protein n=2 Tax=Morganellaceae TaxID=1903414 RepID=A0AAI9HV76_MORMO|nr:MULTISPECIES: hypothetical protein [Providencia]EJV1664304.1 hypothetical protein [Klebsiella pneumoniae]EKW8762758.1 hypothetical protein [Morganella morganii]HEJ9424946.1 hypothetical protein [Proteus mirabilis]ELI9034647.1 hypothetical protein [Morganella morganii]MBX6950032.1 hypothetical protein [Providencia rettgeri]